MSLKEDFIGQNVENQSLQYNEKNAKKKSKKKPAMAPVPGLKAFYSIKIVVKRVFF